MGTIYGYCRISTPSQKIERQVKNIIAAYPSALNHMYKEVYTGRDFYGRKEFNKLLNRVKSGDTIVFDSVSRMSRDSKEGVETYFDLFDKGVELVFLKEPYINTSVYRTSISQSIDKTGNEIMDCYIDAINKALRLSARQQIQIVFDQAEKEVSDLRERTKEGLRIAKESGKRIGTQKGDRLHVKKKEPAKKLIRKYCRNFDGSLNDTETIQMVGVARNTYYKYKKEIFEELATEQ